MLPDILEQTTIADIQKLVTDRVPESIKLEYKRDNYRINNTNADDKKKQCKELLKDTSAFANSQGGDLIIGVDEPKGTSGSVVGIETSDADNLKRQMIAIIRNGTDLTLVFTIHTVELSTDRHVLIIRVRRSSHGPHKVSFQGEPGSYWCRDSGGAHEMTSQEVGKLAKQSQSLLEQIEAFRKNRIEAIDRNECPVALSSHRRMVFHFIPEVAFSGFRVKSHDLVSHIPWMPILHFVVSQTHEYNSDGIVTYDRDAGIPTSGYVQLYRNGIVESVVHEPTFFNPNDLAKQTRLFDHSYIREIQPRLKNYFELFRKLEVLPPVWLYMSFIGLDGCQVYSNDFLRSQSKLIREKTLLMPGQEIEDFGADIKGMIKPGFDKLWNAGGYPNCPL